MMVAYCFLAVFYCHCRPCGRRTNINTKDTKDKSPPTLFLLIRCDVEQDGEGWWRQVEAGGGSVMALCSAASDWAAGRWGGGSGVFCWNCKNGCERKSKMCRLSRQSMSESGLREKSFDCDLVWRRNPRTRQSTCRSTFCFPMFSHRWGGNRHPDWWNIFIKL